MRRRSLRNWVLGGAVLVLLSGCGSTPRTHFYQLNALPDSAIEDGQYRVKNGKVVGIGPVEIPSYVDRAQMVVRTGETELKLLEFHRWAEPLSQNLIRVLIENVSQHLSNHEITVVRWDDGLQLDYRVRIEVTRFDFISTGEVTLFARWIILGKDRQVPLALKTSRFEGVAIPGDYGSLVSEMSGHVESLSQEIVESLLLHL